MSAHTSPAIPALDPRRLTPRLWGILAVVIIADAVDLMDATVTNVAAPTIVRDIGGGEALVKWLGASYALALGVLLVVGGRLGDRFGKRRTMIVGMAGFGVASVLCGLALDPAVLIGARLMQGAFGALLIPQGFGILITTFSRQQFPTAVSVFAPALGGSAILGPIVAGLIIGADIGGLDWRPVFLINVILCGVGILAAIRLLPRDDLASLDRMPIDAIGAGLLAVAMSGLIFGLIQGSDDGWGGVPSVSLGVGVAALAAFALRQARARFPLILPSLLRNRGFDAGLALALTYFAAVSGFSYVVSLFFQLELHLTPTRAALGLTPLMVGIIAASFAGRPLVPRFGRRLVVAGLIVTLAAVATLWLTAQVAGDGLSVGSMAPAVAILGLGMGSFMASVFDVAIGDIAPEEAGSASGSLNAVQQLAAAIGSAAVTTVYFAGRSDELVQGLTSSLLVVGGITVLCLGLVWLLPRRAAPEGGGH